MPHERDPTASAVGGRQRRSQEQQDIEDWMNGPGKDAMAILVGVVVVGVVLYMLAAIFVF